MDAETRNTLRSAHDEILGLRARLAAVEPKAHAYDTIARIARLSMAEESRGEGVDIAWRIRSLLERPEQGSEEQAEEVAVNV